MRRTLIPENIICAGGNTYRITDQRPNSVINSRTHEANTRTECRVVGEGSQAINDRAEVLIQFGVVIPEFVKFVGLCLEYMQDVIGGFAESDLGGEWIILEIFPCLCRVLL